MKGRISGRSRSARGPAESLSQSASQSIYGRARHAPMRRDAGVVERGVAGSELLAVLAVQSFDKQRQISSPFADRTLGVGKTRSTPSRRLGPISSAASRGYRKAATRRAASKAAIASVGIWEFPSRSPRRVKARCASRLGSSARVCRRRPACSSRRLKTTCLLPQRARSRYSSSCVCFAWSSSLSSGSLPRFSAGADDLGRRARLLPSQGRPSCARLRWSDAERMSCVLSID